MRNIKCSFIVTFLLISRLLIAQSSEIEDPYIWLEEVESKKSLEWVKTQNKISEKRITSNPLFEPLKEKLLNTFNDKDKIAYPSIVGDYVYNFWTDEKNERGLLRRMLFKDYVNHKNDWETILDFDELSKKEKKQWVYEGVSWLKPDNKLCLITLSNGGKDESEIREFDIETRSFVQDGFVLGESKGGASWIDRDHLLVYRNFGKESLTESGYPRQAKIWKRGTPIEEAKMIYETDKNRIGVFGQNFYRNGKKITIILNAKTFYEYEAYYLQNNKLKKIDIPSDSNIYGFFKTEAIIDLQSDWNINGKVFNKGSLVSFDLNQALEGKFDVKTIYKPNKTSSFTSTSISKDFIIVNTMNNVKNVLYKYKFENNSWAGKEIEAPKLGSISLGSSSMGENNRYFFTFSNFITPTTLYFANNDDIKIFKKNKDNFNTYGLVVNQYMATSKDGTSIPYFIVHKKDIILNSKNPTLIYAYGGFNSASRPSYNTSRGIGWIEQGGVYVLANIRGGGEFGPDWHQAALKEKRQNAYDDFYAVSEDLIKKGITSPKHLGVYGWSNGGLMAGVVFTQRPELYNAVVVGAPLLDMKRYSKLLAGASWVAEYGNPDIPEEWEYIKKYSPYHNILEDKKYPEVLFVTSTKDDRVHPGHARKMAAKMMNMGHPFLYHETVEGGHGGASTNEQSADMLATIYTYLHLKLSENQNN
ncbi:prolyl oligopeptidase family serine peptidase [uncultured Aquimarina sp.]|uniref:prolyl oligopeptidase family serine peptidase n=1 Tax=uncultured Aquimarina sp. TaxID=575652 RepID=UPI002610552E|nr:prolyl oligopeptidase family serine peptidase [uncultured Aquimarina sp.]